MKVVVQRVSKANVRIDDTLVANISKGLLIFIGITHQDTISDVEWLVNKVANLRIFNDSNSVMNQSLIDVHGQALVVSQFTLHALTKKGNRPSYIEAAKPEVAIPLYEAFLLKLNSLLQKPVQSGVFGADMKVELINDGPVTILIDSKS